MNKIIGYIIALVGLAGVIVYVFPKLKERLTFLESVDNLIILIASLIIIAIGLLFVFKGRRRKPKGGSEVPIFQGRDVVGYRQH